MNTTISNTKTKTEVVATVADSANNARTLRRYVKTQGYDDLVFMSSADYFSKEKKDFLSKLATFCDKNHQRSYASAQKRLLFMTLGLAPQEAREEVMGQMAGANGFYVLTKGGDMVAVGQLDGATTLTTITVPKKFRKQGHARALVRILGAMSEVCGNHIHSPANPEMLRLFAAEGWTRADDTVNPDGSLDVMTERNKPLYLASVARPDKRIFGDDQYQDFMTVIMTNIMLLETEPKFAVPKK